MYSERDHTQNSQIPAETWACARNYGHKVCDCYPNTAQKLVAASANQSKCLSAVTPHEAKNMHDSQQCLSTKVKMCTSLCGGSSRGASPRWFSAKLWTAYINSRWQEGQSGMSNYSLRYSQATDALRRVFLLYLWEARGVGGGSRAGNQNSFRCSMSNWELTDWNYITNATKFRVLPVGSQTCSFPQCSISVGMTLSIHLILQYVGHFSVFENHVHVYHQQRNSKISCLQITVDTRNQRRALHSSGDSKHAWLLCSCHTYCMLTE